MGPRIDSMTMQTLGDIGERAAIDRILAQLGRGDGSVIEGAGDDCAVVRPAPGCDDDLLLTSDPVIEGVHFDPATPPELVGRKALGRVLSDIAAMGGEPAWALLNLVAPASTPVSVLDALYRGAGEQAGAFGLVVVGGDMTAGRTLQVHAFAVGRVPRGRAVLRSGASAGDDLFVTGALGGSRAGRHLSFSPRVREGVFLRGWAGAMIDLSDGLATDLGHLACRSGVGARVELERVPVSAEARALDDGTPPVQHALRDGEDFELLFTVPAARADTFRGAWAAAFDLPCSRIGAITGDAAELVVEDGRGRRTALCAGGYEHWHGEAGEGR